MRIYLPQHTGKMMQVHSKTGWQTYLQAATDETILIVDDESAMRTVITGAIGGALWRRICT